MLGDDVPAAELALSSEPAFASTTTPDIMFSRADQPTRPVMWISRPVDEPAAEVAEASLETDAATGQDPDAEGMLQTGIRDLDLLDPLLIEEPAEVGVDPPSSRSARVEARRLAVDLRDLRDFHERFGEPPRVVRDLGHRFQTSTSRSYGS